MKLSEFNDPSTRPDKGNFKSIVKDFKGPYITAEPEITVQQLSSTSGYIVAASDGLWDYLNKSEVATILENNKLDKNKIVEELFNEVMRRSASKFGITVNELMNIPPGKNKRSAHDDLSIVVVDVRNQI